MATPDELRDDLARARAEFRSALESVTGNWDAPVDGDDWNARQVAEHAIASEAAYTTAVCTACGYPGVDRPELALASPAEAIAALDDVIELCNKKLKYVTDEDLKKTHPKNGASTEALMLSNAEHLREHAAQLRLAVEV